MYENKNFSNPSGIIKNPLTNMQPKNTSVFSHIYIIYICIYIYTRQVDNAIVSQPVQRLDFYRGGESAFHSKSCISWTNRSKD